MINPSDDKPQDIILSFDPLQGKYIKSLPLHETQQILEDNDIELRIKLKLYVTQDLYMELLSYGANIKVIEPKLLAKQVRQAHEYALWFQV
ncbi:MAG: WYL domain-containing protein [Chitinophagaceae bacterium]|nr:WYL domain-containing protein [Chitinophagaceae bacterium]